MTRATVVEVSGVEKTYRRLRRPVKALAGVSLEIPAGRVTAVVGRNGAGKTTLLNIIAGFLRPDRGRVIFPGSARPRLGWLAEGDPLPPALTLRRLVTALCPDEGSRREAAALISELGLAEPAWGRVGELSWGQRRRAGLALALAAPGGVSFLDEPLMGVDPLEQDRCKRAIRRTADAGRAVVIATHLLAEIEGLVDHVVVLDGGRVLFAGAVGALTGTAEGGGRLREAVVALLSDGGDGEATDR